jgi:cytidine deaminase
MTHAYTPYSHLDIGAAVLTDDDRVFAGANVENAAYPQGNCAEASALAAMASAGGRTITQVVVASEIGVAPCGGCRQRLKEFGGPETVVHLADRERVHTTLTLADLLPHAFTQEDLPS